MKLTKSIKKTIETFLYIAVIATMIFHYGVASVIFDSVQTVEAIPKWPMYGMPIFLAAGLTIFIAYPIYRKEETEPEE
jgi:hypothetical protein